MFTVSELASWQWLSDNSKVISLWLSLLMLVVWAIYLQHIYSQFRDRRRSSILITRAAGRGMRSRCLITNLGSSPVYVTSLIGKLRIGEQEIELQLTDLQEQPEDLGSEPLSRIEQGSLCTGEYLNIGHFDDIIRRMLQSHDETDLEVTEVEQIELTVVAFHGWEDLPVGAARSFKIQPGANETPEILPISPATKQISRRSRRRQLCRILEVHR